MRLKELSKRIAVYTCVATLAVSGINVAVPIAYNVCADANIQFTGESISLDIIGIDGVDTDFCKEYDVTGYSYLGWIGANADSTYKYLELTYSGEADPFNEMRFVFEDNKGNQSEATWFAAGQAHKFVTVEGTNVPEATAESQTVVIDLEASGINTANGIKGLHLHVGGGLTGKITIESAKLLAKKGDAAGEIPTEEPTEKVTTEASSSELIILDGDEKGESALIGTYSNTSDAYKYCGYATFKDLVDPNYNYYFQMTYTGNILELRLEFNQMPGNIIDVPFFFTPEGQEFYFVTKDGSDIPLVGDNTTITIDLAKSGVLWKDYHSGFHIHCSNMATNGDIVISDARLIRGEKLPVEETTTKVPATTKAPETTKKVAKPAQVKIKSAIKKKTAKKAKITFKKVKSATKYKIQICTNKKFKKAVIKKTVKQSKKATITATVPSKKFKANKKYYVRVRAVKVVNKKSYPGKWSKVKAIKVKK